MGEVVGEALRGAGGPGPCASAHDRVGAHERPWIAGRVGRRLVAEAANDPVGDPITPPKDKKIWVISTGQNVETSENATAAMQAACCAAFSSRCAAA